MVVGRRKFMVGREAQNLNMEGEGKKQVRHKSILPPLIGEPGRTVDNLIWVEYLPRPVGA